MSNMRPSGSHSVAQPNPAGARPTTSDVPSRSTAMISPAPQCENQRRSSCQRGDSTKASPSSNRVVSRVAILWLLSADGTRPYSTTNHTGPSSTVVGMAMADGDRQSTRKRTAIVDAATITFLHKGYLGTSMDEIAALAGVSKQTVYKHFADKERLFSEVVVSTVNEASDPVHAEVLQLRDSGDLEADLRDLARRQLTLVLQPKLMQLRRLVIAESPRFPELGRTFYEQGPGRTITALAATFERLAARGLLASTTPTSRRHSSTGS